MSYNLIHARWIPISTPSGEARWIAPAEIGELDEEHADIEWGRPEFRVAAHELLIGMFAVALAEHLEDSSDWKELFDKPLPRQVLAAKLAPLERYFELDGEGPRFLQDLEPIAGEARPPDVLLIDAPGENTLKNGADIFTKRDRFGVFSRKAAIVALQAMQAFAPSGGAGHRTSMRGGGPLTTLVTPRDPTLWRRIVANLPLMSDPDLRPPDDLGLVFPWAKPTRLSAGGVGTQPGRHAHPLQCYFGMPRRIRLVFAPNPRRIPCAITGEIDDVVVTGFVTSPWGVSYGVWRHPLSPYYPGKPGEPPLPIHAQNGSIGYRDWVSYLFRGAGDGVPDLRAGQVVAFEKVFRAAGARLRAAGFVTDNMKCLDWAEGEAPLYLLPNTHAQERLARLARDEFVPAAGTVVFALRGALREALGVDDAQKTPIAAAVENFWIATKEAFFKTLDESEARLRGLDKDVTKDEVDRFDLREVNEKWLAEMRRAALAIFERTAPVDRLGDLGEQSVKRVIGAAKSLCLCLWGHAKLGGDLFKTLGLPPPERRPPKPENGASQPQEGGRP